jgi:hypothetical protein
MTKWKYEDLSPTKLFIRFQINRDRSNRSLKIYQTFYITKLLERLSMYKSNPTKLPIPAGIVSEYGHVLNSRDRFSPDRVSLTAKP